MKDGDLDVSALCILLMAGIAVLGGIVLKMVGGWEAFSSGLRALSASKPQFFEVPGLFQKIVPGGPWTALMILTYLFALMGIQSSPAFSMWAFSNRDPRPFPWQQAIASSLIVWPRLTRQGVVAGLIVGLLAVSVTYLFPEYRYPLTIHSAGWGIFLNLLVAVLVSLYGPQPTAEEKAKRDDFHRILRETCGLTPHKKKWLGITWVFTIFWFVMAIGPGTLLGSNLDVWIAGVPLLWIWQIVWWLIGVGMMVWLCFYMEMSTMPRNLEKVLVTEERKSLSIYPGIEYAPSTSPNA